VARLRKTVLLLPLTGFLLVFFVLPMAWFLSYAVREAEVPRALPETLEVLAGWTLGQPVPEAVYPAMARDMVEAADSGTMANAARRINYELAGSRSALTKPRARSANPTLR